LQRQATHSVSILASLSSFRVIRKTKKEALTGSVCTVHDENEAAHVSLLLGVRRKENISFRVSNATLNGFSLGKNVARTRGYVLSLSLFCLVFDRVGVLNNTHRLPRVLPGRSFSLFFSSVFSPVFSRSPQHFEGKNERDDEKRTMRR
jgi:hypothetical protein